MIRAEEPRPDCRPVRARKWGHEQSILAASPSLHARSLRRLARALAAMRRGCAVRPRRDAGADRQRPRRGRRRGGWLGLPGSDLSVRPGYFVLQAALTFWTSARLAHRVLGACLRHGSDPCVYGDRVRRPVQPVADTAYPRRARGVSLSDSPQRDPPALPSRHKSLIAHFARSDPAVTGTGESGKPQSREPCPGHRAVLQMRGPAQCANTRSVSRRMKVAAAGPVAGPS